MRTLAANINTGGVTASVDTFHNVSFSGGTNDFENVYSYDTIGDMTGIRQIANPTSDGATPNDVQSKNVVLTYDGDQRLTGVDMYQSADTSDQVASAVDGYDRDSNLTDMTYFANSDHTGTPLAGYHWDYNTASVATDEYSRNDSSATTPDDSYGSGSNWAQVTYTYDHTAQLTAAGYSTNFTDAPADYSADYDANGDRATVTGIVGTGTTTYTESSSTNRLLFDGSYYYQYDAEGNRTAKYQISSGSDKSLGTQDSPNANAVNITIYTWNNANQMTSVTFYNTAAHWHAETWA
jgi:hypothetical protein